jgi:hypothetical protein
MMSFLLLFSTGSLILRSAVSTVILRSGNATDNGTLKRLRVHCIAASIVSNDGDIPPNVSVSLRSILVPLVSL